MWVFVSIVSMVIRVAVGTLESEHTSPERTKLNYRIDGAFEDQVSKHFDDFSKASLGEALLASQRTKQDNLSQDLTENSGPDKNRSKRSAEESIAESKKSEIVPISSWFYFPTIKARNLPLATRPDSTQEKKSQTFNPWGGKRNGIKGKIERPIRVPFYSWAGKRAHGYSYRPNFETKKIADLYMERNAERDFLNNQMVKRLAEFFRDVRKTPFNSWGGKRSKETISDLDETVKIKIVPTGTTAHDEALAEKQDAWLKDNKRRIPFNSWGGKRSNDEDHSLRINNETTNNEDAGEEAIRDYWLPTPKKRSNMDHLTKAYFNPWGGKRNTYDEALLLTNRIFEDPMDSVKDRQVFFPWGG